jgi:hypothetical protein
MQDGLIRRLCRTRRHREVASLKATQDELSGERGAVVDEALAHTPSSSSAPIADLLKRPSKYGVRIVGTRHLQLGATPKWSSLSPTVRSATALIGSVVLTILAVVLTLPFFVCVALAAPAVIVLIREADAAAARARAREAHASREREEDLRRQAIEEEALRIVAVEDEVARLRGHGRGATIDGSV